MRKMWAFQYATNSKYLNNIKADQTFWLTQALGALVTQERKTHQQLELISYGYLPT